MKTFNISVLFILAFISLSFKPYYTEPAKLASLESGMSVSEVNKKLGVDPYDVYYTDRGLTLLSYKYRLRLRKLETGWEDRFNDESSQKAGKTYYDKEKTAYLFFFENSFISLITEDGIKNSNYILLENNTLKVINDKEFVFYSDREILWNSTQAYIFDIQKGLTPVKPEKVKEKSKPTNLNNEDEEFNLDSKIKKAVPEANVQDKEFSHFKSINYLALGINFINNKHLENQTSKFGFGFSGIRTTPGSKIGYIGQFGYYSADNSYYNWANSSTVYDDVRTISFNIGATYKAYTMYNEKLTVFAYAAPGFKHFTYNEEGHSNEKGLKFSFALGAIATYHFWDIFGVFLTLESSATSFSRFGLTIKPRNKIYEDEIK